MAVGRLVTAHKRGSDVVLWLRTEYGKERVVATGFKPYFYAPSPDGNRVAIDGARVSRVYAELPEQVPSLRSRYSKHYEADIPYAQRFLIDAGIRKCVEWPGGGEVYWKLLRPANCSIPLRAWYIDIEVDASGGFPDVRRATSPVTSITVHAEGKYATLLLGGKDGRRDGWVIKSYESDLELLHAFSRLLSSLSPDVLAGWNVVDFDLAYLSRRARRLGVKLSFEPFLALDMMDVYRFMGHQTLSLKHAYESLGLGKLDKPGVRGLAAMTPEELAEYNRKDVEALVKIDQKLGLVEYALALREAVGLAELHPMTNTRLLDPLFLRETLMPLPSRQEHEREKYRGAIVFDPVPGLHSGVADFDVSRCYPSIILSFNISPETYTSSPGPDDIKLEEGGFRRRPEGLVPRVTRKLWQERDRLEEELVTLEPGSEEWRLAKRKRDAVKFLLNSVYGYLAFPKSRLYNPKLAATVTSLARQVLLFLRRFFEEKGFPVLYGDTDSIFVRVPLAMAEEMAGEAERALADWLREKYNVESRIKLSLDKYYSKLLLTDVKKRYAGIVVREKGREASYLNVVGFEPVRSDTPPFIAEVLTKALEAILGGGDPGSVLARAELEARTRPLEEVAIPKRIDKPFDGYKVLPPHVRGALYANRYLGDNVQPGQRVYMLWVKGIDGLPKTDVVAVSDLKLLEGRRVHVDWDRMMETTLRNKASAILKWSGGGLDRWL